MFYKWARFLLQENNCARFIIDMKEWKIPKACCHISILTSDLAIKSRFYFHNHQNLYYSLQYFKTSLLLPVVFVKFYLVPHVICVHLVYIAGEPQNVTIVEELQEQQNILTHCVEQLEMSELARAALISHLKEALREQVDLFE